MLRPAVPFTVVWIAGCGVYPMPGPRLDSVAPVELSWRYDAVLTLQGGPFEPALRANFDRPGESAERAPYFVRAHSSHAAFELGPARVLTADTLELRANLPEAVGAGSLSIELVDPHGRSAELRDAVVVLECSSTYPCAEHLACEAGRCVPECPDRSVSYADEDGDGRGAPDSVRTECGEVPTDRVAEPGDCDDRDPLTHEGAVERCDARDNDCDGDDDEPPACPSNPGWHRRTDTGGETDDWQTARAVGRNNLGIAGRAGRIGGRIAPAGFTLGTCAGEWSTSWANADASLTIVGGVSGGVPRLAVLSPAGGCSPYLVDGGAAEVAGLDAADGSGGTSALVALTDGRSFRWTPPETQARWIPPLAGVTLADVHGQDGAPTFAVGHRLGAGQPVVFRLDRSTWSWSEEEFPGPDRLLGRRLLTVRVVSERLAYAVGEGSLIVEWDGQRWAVLEPPAPGQVFRGLWAAGPHRLFVASTKLFERDATGWRMRLDAVDIPLYAIAGTDVDDLWVVGHDGFVAHWPD